MTADDPRALLRQILSEIDPTEAKRRFGMKLDHLIGNPRVSARIRLALAGNWTDQVLRFPLDVLAGAVMAFGSRSYVMMAEGLGENQLHPTLDQLRAVAIEAEREVGRPFVLCTLAHVVVEEMEAKDEAIAILRETYTIMGQGFVNEEQVPVQRSPRSAPGDKVPRERRERAKKTAKAVTPRVRYKKAQKISPPAATGAPSTTAAPSERIEPVRRVLTLTERERRDGYRVDHDDVGTVISADVLFSDGDGEDPLARSKVRPCMVLAVGPNDMIVRGFYSKPHPHRRSLEGRRFLGLPNDYSYVSLINERTIDGENYGTIGTLPTELWNAFW